MKSLALAISAALALASSPASAAYIVNISQSGSDVFATGSGNLNLAGLGNPGTGTVTGNLVPGRGRLAVGSGRNNAYSGTITGTNTFGTGNTFLTPDSVTGLPVGFNVQNAFPRFLLVPFGYQSGDDLGTSTATYKNKTLDDFGLIAGNSYTWTWGAGSNQDSFTVNILAAAGVPEPATWGMMIAGFGMIGGAMRRRRQPALRLA